MNVKICVRPYFKVWKIFYFWNIIISRESNKNTDEVFCIAIQLMHQTVLCIIHTMNFIEKREWSHSSFSLQWNPPHLIQIICPNDIYFVNQLIFPDCLLMTGDCNLSMILIRVARNTAPPPDTMITTVTQLLPATRENNLVQETKKHAEHWLTRDNPTQNMFSSLSWYFIFYNWLSSTLLKKITYIICLSRVKVKR